MLVLVLVLVLAGIEVDAVVVGDTGLVVATVVADGDAVDAVSDDGDELQAPPASAKIAVSRTILRCNIRPGWRISPSPAHSCALRRGQATQTCRSRR